MLNLTRRLNQRLVLTVPPSATPTTIEVVVTKVRGNHIGIGVEAPRPVEVARGELLKGSMPGPDEPTDIIEPEGA